MQWHETRKVACFLFQCTGSLFNYYNKNSSFRHMEEAYRHVHNIKVLGNSCLPKPHGEGHQSHVTPSTAFAIHVVWAANNTPGVRQACHRLTFSQRWEERNLWQDIHLFWRLLGKIKTQISWMVTIRKLHRRLNEDFCLFVFQQSEIVQKYWILLCGKWNSIKNSRP